MHSTKDNIHANSSTSEYLNTIDHIEAGKDSTFNDVSYSKANSISFSKDQQESYRDRHGAPICSSSTSFQPEMTHPSCNQFDRWYLICINKVESFIKSPLFAISIITLSQMTFYLELGSIPSSIIEIEQEFNITSIQVGFLNVAFMIGYIISCYTFGNQFSVDVDHFKYMAIGLAGYSVWSFCSAVSPSFISLYILRFLSGISKGMFVLLTTPCVKRIAPESLQTTAVSLVALSMPFGICFGFMIGGDVFFQSSWKNSFALISFFSALMMLMNIFLCKTTNINQIPLHHNNSLITPFYDIQTERLVSLKELSTSEKCDDDYASQHSRKRSFGKNPSSTDVDYEINSPDSVKDRLSDSIDANQLEFSDKEYHEYFGGSKSKILSSDQTHEEDTPLSTLEDEQSDLVDSSPSVYQTEGNGPRLHKPSVFLEKIKRIMTNRVYFSELMGNIILTAATGAAVFWVPYYVSDVIKISRSVASIALGLTCVITATLGGLLTSKFVDWCSKHQSEKRKSLLVDERVEISLKLCCFYLFCCGILTIPSLLSVNPLIFFTLLFFIELFSTSCLPVISNLTLDLIHSEDQVFAYGVELGSIHIFGDLFSPVLVGFVKYYLGFKVCIIILILAFLSSSAFFFNSFRLQLGMNKYKRMISEQTEL